MDEIGIICRFHIINVFDFLIVNCGQLTIQKSSVL